MAPTPCAQHPWHHQPPAHPAPWAPCIAHTLHRTHPAPQTPCITSTICCAHPALWALCALEHPAQSALPDPVPAHTLLHGHPAPWAAPQAHGAETPVWVQQQMLRLGDGMTGLGLCCSVPASLRASPGPHHAFPQFFTHEGEPTGPSGAGMQTGLPSLPFSGSPDAPRSSPHQLC